MTEKIARDWFVKHGPTLNHVLSSSVDIEDHIGKSFVCVTTWANGEGFDLMIQEPADATQPFREQRFEFTWSQWDALRWAIKKIKEAEKSR